MAARRSQGTKLQQDRTRGLIQTTQLVKRLQNYALGQKGPQGETVELDANRLRAIEVLLRKALPDLSAVTHSGDPENPLEHNHNVKARDLTDDELAHIAAVGGKRAPKA